MTVSHLKNLKDEARSLEINKINRTKKIENKEREKDGRQAAGNKEHRKDDRETKTHNKDARRSLEYRTMLGGAKRVTDNAEDVDENNANLGTLAKLLERNAENVAGTTTTKKCVG